MYIKVRAIANSKKEEIISEKPHYFKIFLHEKAERNMANKRIIEIVAKIHKTTTKKVKIINGHHSPSKLLSVDIEN